MMGGGALLLAAVAGYWVLERADKHKGNLKSIGQIVGWVVIVASLVGVACRVWGTAAGTMGWCPKGSMWCPFTGKPMPSTSQPVQ